MITIIDYSINNIWSVQSALEYLKIDHNISKDPEVIKKSTHLILPGVGSFNKAMKNIRKLKIDNAIQIAKENNCKILGICLGMQLLAKQGFEDGITDGLNLIDTDVRLFNKNKLDNLKIPHIGFNNVKLGDNSLLFKNLKNNTDFYFVHSYIMPLDTFPNNSIIHTCTYGESFVAAFEYNNIFGTQFHPEKSQMNGLKVLKNFFKT